MESTPQDLKFYRLNQFFILNFFHILRKIGKKTALVLFDFLEFFVVFVFDMFYHFFSFF